ncbi:MAG: hypothetical protein MR671_06105 [Clostridiales bacterium]|nr:hypothetical protein [Clostridiales bacterium]
MNEAQKRDLIEECMPLVDEVIEDLDDGVMPSEDLRQEGMVGLVRGVDSLSEDPDEWGGRSVEETVKEAIRAAALEAKDAFIELTRKDDRLIAQVELLNQSIDRLTEELGTKPNIDEIANDMGITQDKVIDILKLTGEDLDESKLRKPE